VCVVITLSVGNGPNILILVPDAFLWPLTTAYIVLHVNRDGQLHH